jgi:chlorite dismutase
VKPIAKKALLVVVVLLAALGLAMVAVVVAVELYHRRRFEACAQELDAAVRSAKTIDAFMRDERREWYQTYSHEKRSELLDHIATRSHTEKDAADADAMSNRAHTSAVFNIGDMVYVLFFDRDDRLREYVCLSN